MSHMFSSVLYNFPSFLLLLSDQSYYIGLVCQLEVCIFLFFFFFSVSRSQNEIRCLMSEIHKDGIRSNLISNARKKQKAHIANHHWVTRLGTLHYRLSTKDCFSVAKISYYYIGMNKNPKKKKQKKKTQFEIRSNSYS